VRAWPHVLGERFRRALPKIALYDTQPLSGVLRPCFGIVKSTFILGSALSCHVLGFPDATPSGHTPVLRLVCLLAHL
jgi:hypothetical protein